MSKRHRALPDSPVEPTARPEPRFALFALLTAEYVLLLLVALFALCVLGFALRLPITQVHLPAAIVLTGVVFLLWGGSKAHRKLRGAALAVALLFLYLSALFMSSIPDGSYDGRGYHKEAVIALSTGWNPLSQSVEDVDPLTRLPYSPAGPMGLFIDHYPIFSWVAAASIDRYFGRGFEAGKVFNILLMYAVFFASFGILHLRWGASLWTAAAGGLLMSATPVTVCQVLNHYADGALGLALTLLLVSLLSLRIGADRCLPPACLEAYIAAAIVIAANLKFNGLLYAGAFLLVFGTYYVATERRSRARLRPTLVAAGLGLVVALLLGVHPYYTNWKTHGSPSYPLQGAAAVDILSYNLPPGLENMPAWTQSLVSFLSRSALAFNRPPSLKFPGTFSRSEILCFKDPDVRIGGFGPLFSLVTIVALLLWMTRARGLPREANLAVVLLLVVFLFGPSSWWPRYIPMFSLVPVLIPVAVLSSPRQPKGRRAVRAVRIVSWGLLLGAFVNTGLCGSAAFRYAKSFADTERGIMQHIAGWQRPVRIYFADPLFSERTELDDRGVKYEIVLRPEPGMRVYPELAIGVRPDTGQGQAAP